jgi:hypothetical protein
MFETLKCRFQFLISLLPSFSNRFAYNAIIDALLCPLLDPLEGQTMLSCEKLGLEGRSRLPALKGGRGAC